MAIFIVDGYTGHGKTAYCVKWLFELLKSGERVFPDIRLFPDNFYFRNFLLQKKYPFRGKDIEGNLTSQDDRDNPDKQILYWNTLNDLEFARQGTILCDEGLRVFNARNWAGLSQETQLKITQHRKDSLDLITTCPHYSRIDLVLRLYTETFIRVKLKMGSASFDKSWKPRISRVEGYRLEDLRKFDILGEPKDIEEEDEKKREKILSQWPEPLFEESFWMRKKHFNLYDTTQKVGATRQRIRFVSRVNVTDRDTGKVVKIAYE